VRNSPVSLSILLLALCLGWAPGALSATKSKAAARTAAPPEAGSWLVKVTPDSDAAAKGEKETDDTLWLKSGKFHSPACDSFGFQPVPYRLEGGTWIAETESKTNGTIHWHGETSGDTVSGRMVWTKSDGTVLNFSFSGYRAGSHATSTQPGAAPGQTQN
jgi:hypothetical protein